jgi:pilus assembly protein CpaF
MLMAFNTGHEGGCGTVHANSAVDVPVRLEALASLGGMDPTALHAQLSASIKVVIHVARLRGRRQVSQICVCQRDSTGRVAAVPALIVTADGVHRGPGYGMFQKVLS